ncbi:hypothetical protein ILUMI_01707 [Ignelater luminosus]|uniref:Coiled-coil domain-containing protein 51 n=1 Tax=Ignelater luminosus TaxID=2038154 RepID=A0A8K0GK00_IGNLU|nr:hypothetical protein ILUMI_01707 [Ignelater luminosus]
MYSVKMKLDQIRILNNVVRQTVKNNIKESVSEAPKYINHVKDEVIYKKVGELNKWYTRVLGLDEVKLYQERVVTLQEKLLSVQERRRSIGQQLAEIRKKSIELQDQINKVKRQDDLQRFLDLMKEETEVLKLERDISNNFNDSDREEREVFTAFTNAVRDSHEKQRAQLEYTKYFGLVLSLVGSFLTFCYSTLKKQDLKRFVEEHLHIAAGSSQTVLMQLEENQKQLSKVSTYIDSENLETINLINNNHKELISLLRNINVVEVSTLRNQGTENNNAKGVSNVLNVPIPNSQKIILYGCVALIGIIVMKSFTS